MKTMTKTGLIITALFMLIGLASAQAQPAVHPKAYYDAITYEWTDANNVTHTSAVTELATDPYQIVELLRKVYCDPNFPGPTYNGYDRNGNRENEVYYGAQSGGWNISASDVTPPYEDGYTILMVSVNNNLSLVNTTNGARLSNRSQLINYVRSNIKSVQLLTDGLRVGQGDRAGTVFTIDGTYNRFFMLGKGQSRKKYSGWEGTVTGEQPPFMNMFEQYSPTAGTSGAQITDFYSKMISGDVYAVVHDCASVIENQHYFSMRGKNATQELSLTGMNIFIPDYRMKYWADGNYDGRTMNPYTGGLFASHSAWEAYYAEYNQDYAPMVGIYTIVLDASAAPAPDAEDTYNVTLDWTSSLNTMTGDEVPQDYTIYIIRTDEDGNEYNELLTTVSNQTTYTYPVPQTEQSQTIVYIVYGKPNDGEHDMFEAWSNPDGVNIPGTDDFMGMTLDHFESDFESQQDLNYYRNFINMKNNDDEFNVVTPQRIVNENLNDFTLYRYDLNDPEVKIPVADLQLTPNQNLTRVAYTITYQNQEKRPNYNVNVTTSGNMGTDQNNAVRFDLIQFVDQFTAYTADNDHPNRYAYVLELNTGDKSSNVVEVPVFKTNSTIDGFYSELQVMDDDDATLTPGVKNANVEMNLLPNQLVYYYTLNRGSNGKPNELISLIQHERTTGNYLEILESSPYLGTENEPGVVNRLDNDIITGDAGEFMTYQPVLWTFGEDRVNNDGSNSYGGPCWSTSVGDVMAYVSGSRNLGTNMTWTDEDGNTCCTYQAYLDINGALPFDASIEYEPFMFRVWRISNDIRNYTIDPVSHKRVNDELAERDPHKLVAQVMTTEPDASVGRNGSITFGATQSAHIQFLVRFYYRKAGMGTLRDNTAPMYYVVERLVDWTNISTGIDEINYSNEVSRTYYNAQGIASDKPYDGVNIVITRYSDGTVKTTKVVK